MTQPTKPEEPRDVRPLERAIRLVQAEQAATILEGIANLTADGYAIIVSHNSRTGKAIVRMVNPRGQEVTIRDRSLRDALAHIVQTTTPGPVIAPPAERSGR
jgi:hypothetical protein